MLLNFRAMFTGMGRGVEGVFLPQSRNECLLIVNWFILRELSKCSGFVHNFACLCVLVYFSPCPELLWSYPKCLIFPYFQKMNCHLMAFLIPADERLFLNCSWSFCNHAVVPEVHFHFVLKSCTSLPSGAEKKTWVHLNYFFYLGKVKLEQYLNEGRERDTNKNSSQRDKMRMEF